MPLSHPPERQADRRLTWLWQLLFPSRCLGCGQRDVLLCTTCRATLPWLPAAVCPRCAGPSKQGSLCARCDPPAVWRLGSVRAACRHEGLARAAIHQLKYRHARSVAPLLAEFVATSLATRPLQADLVLPVPLSPRRLRQRGFNQSDLIARHLSQLAPLPAPTANVLVRIRDTHPQVGLTAATRLDNLRGAFTCSDPSLVQGRRCIVVDDVSSTEQLHC
jgi:predicted amidophosphoribosyltransferase